jgi:quinol monooxygenase YgiN
MEKKGQSYSSGEWLVREGSEEEFIEAWTNFIEWSLEHAPGAESFVLARSTEKPRKFLSLGTWERQETWREMPRMQVMLGQCRALCEEFDTPDTHRRLAGADKDKGSFLGRAPQPF